MNHGMPTRRAVVIGALLASGLAAAEAMRPRNRLALTLPPLNLATDIPAAFGDWHVDTSVAPVLPDPTVQAKLDVLYSQVLARTYRNGAGQVLMLSIAYGSDQSSEATSVHRPEFCYSAQGFRVREAGVSSLQLPGQAIAVQRLIATADRRFEPILYWVTLADQATLPGLGRKLTQLRYGLRGQVPDGMLVRTSTIGMDADASFALQASFLQQLHSALPAPTAERIFGTSNKKV